MKKLFTLLYMAIVLLSTSILAQTVYVNSSTGDDTSGDGSSGNPYKTFTKGYSIVSTGGTLDLSGTFTWTDADETGDVVENGFLIEKNLTIQGQGQGQTIIQAATSRLAADRRILSIFSTYTVTINDLVLRYGNAADDANNAEYGGAIDIQGGADITIRNCYIHDNNSWLQGGGIDVYNSTLYIENSTISDNFGYRGAGINCQQSDFTITNSTLTNNQTDAGAYGGAINLQTGSNTVNITNCTIANNTSALAGGGIAFADLNLNIKNTILADNTGNGSPNDFDYYNGTITDNGSNIIEYTSGAYTWSGSNDITGNQSNLNLSSTLADNSTTNGTPTLALSSGSVAIDAGNSSANGSVSIPTTDQRGAARSGNPDIGAYEFEGVLPVELTSFSANLANKSVILNWQTATEVNNYGFEVQRAIKNSKLKIKNWEKVGFLEGAGNSNTTKAYSFSDNLNLTLNHNQNLSYRLKQIDLDGKFTYSKEVEVNVNNLPSKFALQQNYPNPFNPTTTINYSLPAASRVTLNVFNLLGQEVATLVNKQQPAGNYEIKFDAGSAAGGLSSGVYLYKLTAEDPSSSAGQAFTAVKKLVLLK